MTRVGSEGILTGDVKVVQFVAGTGTTAVVTETAAGTATVEIDASANAALQAHIDDATAAHAATAVAFTPGTGIAATTVQAAVEEVVTDQLARGIRQGAGVPTGAPAATELPFAYDTTAVSGGFYFWGGAAWIKVSTIL